jgi:hypothetical protein
VCYAPVYFLSHEGGYDCFLSQEGGYDCFLTALARKPLWCKNWLIIEDADIDCVFCQLIGSMPLPKNIMLEGVSISKILD